VFSLNLFSDYVLQPTNMKISGNLDLTFYYSGKLSYLILEMYLIQVQVCPEHNFPIPRPISIKFHINPTLCRPTLKMYLILGSDLSKAQLSYSPINFHQFDITREAGAEPASFI